MKKFLSLLLLLHCHVWTSAAVTEIVLPIREGRLHTRDVVAEILRANGSSVEVPENFRNHAIKLKPLTLLATIQAWNLALEPQGLSLRLVGNQVVLRIDKEKIAQDFDAFEQSVCQLFGIERDQGRLLRRSPPDCRGPAVVLIHGLDSGPELFDGAAAQLVAAGYDVYLFAYPNDDRIVRNAERLSHCLRALPPDRREDLSLVTHSMGGLVARWMLEDEALYVPGTRRLIACAPPFQGSELARFRGLTEVYDLAANLLQAEKIPAPFSDGLGLAGHDLIPGSPFLLAQSARMPRPGVQYSILAGNRGLLPPQVLDQVQRSLSRSLSDPTAELARRVLLEKLDLLRSFHDGRGDGAVSLDSASLPQVQDRVVLPYHHLEFLRGAADDTHIPALREALQRLPPVNTRATTPPRPRP